MQVGTLFDSLPLWGVVLSTILTVAIAVEGGYRLGRLRKQHKEGEKETYVVAMAGATLGLLAFMLAFTFGLAASRYDARREAVLDESNAIMTAYFNAGTVPEPHQTEIRRLLMDYTDVHLSVFHTGDVDQGIRQSVALQKQMWAHVEALADEGFSGPLIANLGRSLTDVFDLQSKRVMLGMRHRIPGIIWAALYLLSFLAIGTMGYHAGVSGASRTMAIFAMALAYTIVVGLIADLDRPRVGMLTTSQQEIIDARDNMREMTP